MGKLMRDNRKYNSAENLSSACMYELSFISRDKKN